MDNTLSRHLAGQTRTQTSNSNSGEHTPVDLGKLLAELGSKLIREHGFSPAQLQGCSTYVNRTTEPLVRFLVWLQHTPEVGTVLSDLGVWQEDNREPAASALNNVDKLPPAPGDSSWPRQRKHSVA
jgi:hypothetical protein